MSHKSESRSYALRATNLPSEGYSAIPKRKHIKSSMKEGEFSISQTHSSFYDLRRPTDKEKKFMRTKEGNFHDISSSTQSYQHIPHKTGITPTSTASRALDRSAYSSGSVEAIYSTSTIEIMLKRIDDLEKEVKALKRINKEQMHKLEGRMGKFESWLQENTADAKSALAKAKNLESTTFRGGDFREHSFLGRVSGVAGSVFINVIGSIGNLIKFPFLLFKFIVLWIWMWIVLFVRWISGSKLKEEDINDSVSQQREMMRLQMGLADGEEEDDKKRREVQRRPKVVIEVMKLWDDLKTMGRHFIIFVLAVFGVIVFIWFVKRINIFKFNL
ncbi:hypothetical protein ADUPG1_014121 [Aduncisulcus paluster]|uniref:Uncharacterized protein n=1 Tax=Aduncisulcus paluster TaxID=2918883 RepID=A0ABQ5KAV9_9EUKA|nr:hypothetical protein ADUPG1_014121 [Aduncisulcus paluster]